MTIKYGLMNIKINGNALYAVVKDNNYKTYATEEDAIHNSSGSKIIGIDGFFYEKTADNRLTAVINGFNDTKII